MKDLTLLPDSGSLIGWSLTRDLNPVEHKSRIFLLNCPVAGDKYYQAHECVDELEDGATLCLRREPDNRHDRFAIEVSWRQTSNAFKLGYVPRMENLIFARLMDAGKRLSAEITNACTSNPPGREHLRVMISMAIFLEEGACAGQDNESTLEIENDGFKPCECYISVVNDEL